MMARYGLLFMLDHFPWSYITLQVFGAKIAPLEQHSLIDLDIVFVSVY